MKPNRNTGSSGEGASSVTHDINGQSLSKALWALDNGPGIYLLVDKRFKLVTYDDLI